MKKVNFPKKILFLSVIVNIAALFIYIAGATAFFKRGIDLLGAFGCILIFTPTLIFSVISIVEILTSDKKITETKYGIVLALIAIHIIISINAIANTSTRGWIEDIVFEDNKQITSDQKYEYDIELVNWFQTNAKMRFHMRNIISNEDIYINLDTDVDTNSIHGSADDAWSKLSNSDKEGIYYLETTEEFSEEFHVPMEKYEIDLKNKTSKRIRN